MGTRRCLLVAFFAYVLLDLGCPFVPGAFRFDPQESVDAVSAYPARLPALPRITAPPFATTAVVRLAETAAHGASASPPPPVVDWRPHALRPHAAASDPPSSLDDD